MLNEFAVIRKSMPVFPSPFIISLPLAVKMPPEQFPTSTEKFWLSGNSRYMHFSTLPEDPVMASKIKPQRAQRDTESCYFYLSPPLCSLCTLWFSENPFSKISKSLRGFGHCNARYQRPEVLSGRQCGRKRYPCQSGCCRETQVYLCGLVCDPEIRTAAYRFTRRRLQDHERVDGCDLTRR